MAQPDTSNTTGSNTQRAGTTREHQTTQRKGKPVPAGTQRLQQHTAAHPTAQDRKMGPAPHNRHTTAGKKKEAERKKRTKGRHAKKKPGEGGGEKEKKYKKGGGAEGQQDAKVQGCPGRKSQNATDKRGTQKEKKTQQKPQRGQPHHEGVVQTKNTVRPAKGKGEAHQIAPGRPARPTRPREARTRTHTRDLGVASSDLKEAVWASTQNSLGAAAESPVKRLALRVTGRRSDRVHTRKPPQRAEPRTDAAGPRQGQPHRGAPNGYDAKRAQCPCLGRGQRQAQTAGFSASLHVPRAAVQ